MTTKFQYIKRKTRQLEQFLWADSPSRKTLIQTAIDCWNMRTMCNVPALDSHNRDFFVM